MSRAKASSRLKAVGRGEVFSGCPASAAKVAGEKQSAETRARVMCRGRRMQRAKDRGKARGETRGYSSAMPKFCLSPSCSEHRQ